jgi:hypothetical protein
MDQNVITVKEAENELTGRREKLIPDLCFEEQVQHLRGLPQLQENQFERVQLKSETKR